MISIIDYGMGNIHSVYKSLKRIDIEAEVISTPGSVLKAEKLLLPGVGNFSMGMSNLKKKGLADVITERVLIKKIPILGICLGMQLLTEYSEEGDVEGLKLIKAKTSHLKNLGVLNLKIPHVGWNNISVPRRVNLLSGMNGDNLYYFVHSYAVICSNPDDILCETKYGVIFHSGIQKDNIYGVQFHPEKSFMKGLLILKNFASI